MSKIMIRRSSHRSVLSLPYMASLFHVSNSILRVVWEAYLAKDSGTLIGYRIGYRRFFIITYNLSKGVRLFVVVGSTDVNTINKKKHTGVGFFQ